MVEYILNEYPDVPWDTYSSSDISFGWMGGKKFPKDVWKALSGYITSPIANEMSKEQVGEWCEGKEVKNNYSYKLSSQAAVFMLAESQGEKLVWNTLQEKLEHPSEELQGVDARWIQRDLKSAINAQGGNGLRFWNEWRQNSQNASLKLPENERQAFVSSGLDDKGRSYAQIVDFVGMKPEEVLWSLPTVGFSLGEKPQGSLSKFRMGWLTCLAGSNEVRVRTSKGDGTVAYLRFTPIKDAEGTTYDVDIEITLTKENCGAFTDMTWFADPGIQSWVQNNTMDTMITASGKYVKDDELQIFKTKNTLNIDPSSLDKLQESVQNKSKGADSRIESHINGSVVVADSLKGWELRVLGEDKKPLLLQKGFKVGESLPQELIQAIPHVIRRTIVRNGKTLAFAVGPEVGLNKARDRVEKEDEFVEQNRNLATSLAIRGVASMIMRGQVSTAATDREQGVSPLAYDFNEKFLDRSTMVTSGDKFINALNALGKGDIPNLDWLRLENATADREVITMAVNLPLVKSGIDTMPEKFSIVDLLIINAGASYAMSGSLPKDHSVYEMIKPLLIEKEGELYLSNKALKMLADNARVLTQAKIRTLWLINKLTPLKTEINTRLQKLLSFIGEYTQKKTSLPSMIDVVNPTSEMVQENAAKALIQTAGSTAGRRVIQEEDGRVRLKPGIPSEPVKENEEIILNSGDLRRLSSGASQQMESMRRLAENGDRAERKEVGLLPDLHLEGRRWVDAEAYNALAEFAADVLGETYGFDIDPQTQIGFYQEAKAASSAHGGGRSMAFNIGSQLDDEFTKSIKKALSGGELSPLIGRTLEVTLHEGQHLEEGRKEKTFDTHDLVFREAVYKRYSKAIKHLLKKSDTGRLNIEEKVENLRKKHSVTSISGQEFYARLAA